MRTRPLRPLLLCIGLSLALVAGACGSDDEGTSTDAGGDGQSERTVAEAAEDAIGDELGGDCAFLGQFAGVEFAEGFDPSAAFEEGGEIDFSQIYDPLSEQFREIAESAPSDIRDAFETMAEAFGELASELEGLTVDFSDPANIDPEAIAAFEKAGTVVEGDEFRAASDEVEAWVEDNCSAAG